MKIRIETDDFGTEKSRHLPGCGMQSCAALCGAEIAGYGGINGAHDRESAQYFDDAEGEPTCRLCIAIAEHVLRLYGQRPRRKA